jgi:quercetin dioxygenase-like cupin family protein
MRTATLTPVDTEPSDPDPDLVPAEPERDAAGRRSHRLLPLLGMGSGLAFLAVTATLVAGMLRTAPQPAPTALPLDAPAITVSARDISVVSQVYAPGEASGWHAHSGIHAVTVLSGVVTVYDAQCRPQTFEPGRPYVGGQELHLVRNEGGVPVEMAVTYLSPSTGAGPTRNLPAPAGCA